MREDGSIVAWGNNEDGQCDVPEPNTGFTDFDGGHCFSIGLKEDGAIVAWGNDEDLTDIPEPDSSFIAVASGDYHCLCLRAR